MSSMLEETKQTYEESTVLFRVVNRVAIVTLNRATALNALSHDMVKALSGVLHRCRTDDGIVAVVLRASGEKAFCAGGDVRELYHRVRNHDRTWLEFFIDEYRLDYAVHKFQKPVVAIVDGVTMGGGMGLAQGAWLRVATERTRMAMPETRIGLIPDVGASSFMARMPVEMALYVALTGVSLNGADALRWNLADVLVPSGWLGEFEDRLANVSRAELDPAFPDRLKRSLRAVFDAAADKVRGESTFSLSPLIKHYFNPRLDVGNIVMSLRAGLTGSHDRDATQWLTSTLALLEQHSPTMLCVARQTILRGRAASLADCFRMELGCVSKAVAEGDFIEGVRAHLVDKDHKPRWSPGSLWEIRPERLQYFLSSPWRIATHPLHDIERLHP
ncbi:enoyl-CoA hydratase/isomerase family protein [Paraburkholderia jirisanensis]